MDIVQKNINKGVSIVPRSFLISSVSKPVTLNNKSKLRLRTNMQGYVLTTAMALEKLLKIKYFHLLKDFFFT